MKFRNKDEFQEWRNVIKHFESIVGLANEENEHLRQFFDTQLHTAQFWKRYATERTNDPKLRHIAESSLEQVETEIKLTQTSIPAFLRKMLSFLKQFQVGS